VPAFLLSTLVCALSTLLWEAPSTLCTGGGSCVCSQFLAHAWGFVP